MKIVLDDLSGPAVQMLLHEHLQHMRSMSPPESTHALDLDGLRRPEISFWSAWHDGALMGCGALKQLTPDHGEIKSMRTAQAFRRQGVARRLLDHIIDQARLRGLKRLSLETGSMASFEPARQLYRSRGFVPCAPFASYVEDPNSVFMTRVI